MLMGLRRDEIGWLGGCCQVSYWGPRLGYQPADSVEAEQRTVDSCLTANEQQLRHSLKAFPWRREILGGHARV